MEVVVEVELMRSLVSFHIINMAKVSKRYSLLNIPPKMLEKSIAESNERLKRQNNNISIRIKDAKKSIKSKEKEIKDLDKKLKVSRKEADTSGKNLAKIKADIYSLEKKTSKLNEVIKTLKGEEYSQNKNIKQLKSSKEKLNDTLAGLEIRKQRASKLIHDIEGLEVRKSVAQSDLNKLFKSRSIVEDKIASLEDFLDKSRDNLKIKQSEFTVEHKKLTDKLDIVKGEIVRNEADRDYKLRTLESDIGHKNAELSAVNSLIDKAENEYIGWEKRIKKAKSLVDIEERKVQTVKDAYETWRINTLEQVAKMKMKNKIDMIDKAGLAEILGNG